MLMTLATNLGFSRIGSDRELKHALEGYWAGKLPLSDLIATAAGLRFRHWRMQKAAGIDIIPSNDFSLYDHVLDTALMVNAIPSRFRGIDDPFGLMFAMARGTAEAAPLEMTKWFDTNYHYLVPEIADDVAFARRSDKPIVEFKEALALGIRTRPVLLSPASFLHLSAGPDGRGSAMRRIGELLPVYADVMKALVSAGAEWIQLDEPILALDLGEEEREAIAATHAYLKESVPEAKRFVAVYFGGLGPNRDLLPRLQADALHLDLVSDTDGLADLLGEGVPENLILSLGLVNGRNVWRTDLRKAVPAARAAIKAVGTDRVWIAPSCSLLHAPVDLAPETELPQEVKYWMAFGSQKLGEVRAIASAVDDAAFLDAVLFISERIAESKAKSAIAVNPKVRERLASADLDARRNKPFRERRLLQHERTPLPLLPTTMIGSMPQTAEIRALRKGFKDGLMDQGAYIQAMRRIVRDTIRWQEDCGLDVLIHGEPERNDMVEYFAGMLHGVFFTKNGWVQSYGSRCVKPPVIAGDVSRKQAMTVEWSAYAQSLTKKPVKGMLTGPVTMLKWSFVREDLPLRDVCFQLALALRDEVKELEEAGIGMIQIDEPALREGLPLRSADQAAYLEWAVKAFRFTASGVRNDTQIHTHMCYADVEDILLAICGMDADVISLEASRSAMGLLRSFNGKSYPHDVGPGVYDIHSPRVPTVEEMEGVIRAILGAFPKERVWVNPDCGLKTRRWEEVEPAIYNMIEAARRVRAGL
jgi:5-methyltetrahydropteroyltriglutamate--homocysteine methyltransferase